MKAIVACPSLNFPGGAERLCMCLIKALKDRDHRVVLATLDKTRWNCLKEVFGEVFKPDEEIYLFSAMPKVPVLTLRQALVALSYVLELSWLTSRRKCDLLINMRGEIVDSIGDLVYMNAVPLRLMQIYPQIQPEQGAQWQLYGRIYSFLARMFRTGKSVIVANSSFNQHVIQRDLGKEALVVHPGVVLERIKSLPDNLKRENVVVTVSRFRVAKGLGMIPQVAKTVKDAKFILIGISDESSEDCIKQIADEKKKLGVEDRLQVFSNVPYDFTIENLKKAKVFLQTQQMEAFGMAIIEAMAAGCVPVVPRDGGPWFDILEEREGVYGFSYRSASEAAQKIRMILENEKLRAEVSARASRHAMDFDSSVFESRISTMVKKVYLSKLSRTRLD